MMALDEKDIERWQMVCRRVFVTTTSQRGLGGKLSTDLSTHCTPRDDTRWDFTYGIEVLM